MKYLDFSQEEVERAARYHRPLYASLAAGTALSAAVYAVLAWPGRGLFGAVSGLGWAGAAAAWGAIVVAAAALARLPLGVWSGFVRERRWGFSTQSPGGWLADQAKGLAVSVALAAGGWAAVVALARALPGWWPAAAAAGLALAALFFSFLAPVVLEPLFNRFRPLADERLAGELRALGERAGVPVRNVLVADASRRTTKVNAYVSGLGRTRRVVLYDTLLAAAGEPEIEAGRRARARPSPPPPRRQGHAARDGRLGRRGRAALGGPRARTLRPRVSCRSCSCCSSPFEIAALPAGAALSRRWERAADRCSLELTGDAGTFERAMTDLARRNLSDLAPPRLVYLLLFSHPTPPERLALRHGATWLKPGRLRCGRAFARPSRSRSPLSLDRPRADSRLHGRRGGGRARRRLARAAGGRRAHAHRRRRARRRDRRLPPRDPARARPVDVRARPRRDPRRPGQRRHAARRRGADRLHRRAAARLAAGRARRDRARGRARRRRRQPRRDARPLARRPHQPERARRVPPRRHRPRRLRRHGARRRARARDRLVALRPDRRPARRRADAAVELVAAARIGPSLPRGVACPASTRTRSRARSPRTRTSSRCTTSTSGR